MPAVAFFASRVICFADMAIFGGAPSSVAFFLISFRNGVTSDYHRAVVKTSFFSQLV